MTLGRQPRERRVLRAGLLGVLELLETDKGARRALDLGDDLVPDERPAHDAARRLVEAEELALDGHALARLEASPEAGSLEVSDERPASEVRRDDDEPAHELTDRLERENARQSREPVRAIERRRLEGDTERAASALTGLELDDPVEELPAHSEPSVRQDRLTRDVAAAPGSEEGDELGDLRAGAGTPRVAVPDVVVELLLGEVLADAFIQ